MALTIDPDDTEAPDLNALREKIKLKTGNTVRLPGGEQLMTVENVVAGKLPIKCVWHTPKGKLQRGNFVADSLIRH